ncbi:hypothetical protein BDF22DRAFT_662476 [Syncephalis plumigaleata]|nr:hypothetical protein BDF22DRAFT_662476 [Syncephalis plumigaleata]
MSHPPVYHHPPVPPPPASTTHPIPYGRVLPPPLPSPTSATYPPPMGSGPYSAGLPPPLPPSSQAQAQPSTSMSSRPSQSGAIPSGYYGHSYVASAPVSPLYYRSSFSRTSPGHGAPRDPHHISPTLLPPPSGYRPHGPPAGVEVPQQPQQPSTPSTPVAMGRRNSNASITSPYSMEQQRPPPRMMMMGHRRHPSLESLPNTRMIPPSPLAHQHPPPPPHQHPHPHPPPPVGYTMVPYLSPMAHPPPPPPGTYYYDGTTMPHPLPSPYYYYPPRPVVAPSQPPSSAALAGTAMVPTGTSPHSSLTVIEENGYQTSGSKSRTSTTVSPVSSQTSASMMVNEPQFRASWKYASPLSNTWIGRPVRYQRRRSEPNLCRVNTNISKSTDNTTLPSHHDHPKNDDDSMAVLASAASYVSHHDDHMEVEEEGQTAAAAAASHGSNVKNTTSSRLEGDHSKSSTIMETSEGDDDTSSSTATMISSSATSSVSSASSLSPSAPLSQLPSAVNTTKVKEKPWLSKSGVTVSSPDNDDRRHLHQYHTNTAVRMTREHDHRHDHTLREVDSTSRLGITTSTAISEHDHNGSFRPWV